MRMWTSLAMFKLSFGNKDQCKSQCDEKYAKTQEVVGIQKQLIDMMGKVLNETDNIVQGMPTSRSAFPNDLQKYKDVSGLARDLMSTFMQIPRANRHIAKMMMKLIKHEKKPALDDDDDDDDDYDNDDDGDDCRWVPDARDIEEFDERGK